MRLLPPVCQGGLSAAKRTGSFHNTSSVVLGAATTEAVEFARILAQCAPKSVPAVYLRTSDAWTRRASAVRLSVLESIRSMLVSDEPDPNVIDVSDLRVPDARDIVLTENAYTDHAVANGDANTQISIAMKPNPSNARSEVSVAHSTAHTLSSATVNRIQTP